MSLLAFHGTAEIYLPSIMREGLKPGGAKGADVWAAHMGDRHFLDRNAHDPKLYISEKKSIAAQFAAYTADLTHSVPVILRVAIDDPSAWEPDRQFDGGTGAALWSYSSIPPADILYHETVPAKLARDMVTSFTQPSILQILRAMYRDSKSV